MNKYIRQLITEQFNIGNMNLNNTKPKQNMNIFNKNLMYLEIYNNILNVYRTRNVTKNDIEYMNDFVSVIKPKDIDELRFIVAYYSDNHMKDSLNWLDVSEIRNMTKLFKGPDNSNVSNEYKGDISKWDVSNVTNMSYMFYNSEFDGDISQWDVSNVRIMNNTFGSSIFNNDISGWDVSNVRNMNEMFMHSSFNGNISNWDVSNVRIMKNMFYDSMFNQDISRWDVSKVKDMSNMFVFSEFNQDISEWDVSKVKNFEYIFGACHIKEEYKPARFRSL